MGANHGVSLKSLTSLSPVYSMPARNPIPAPRLITTHPTPIAPGISSVLPADPVMFMPAIAVPVGIVLPVMLMPLMPLITWPLDIVIEASIDMPLMSFAMTEPLAATAAAAAAAVGSLSHIIVTTLSSDAAAVVDVMAVMPDCARARGASARRVRALSAERDLGCMFAGLNVIAD
jgi:hypothetical protein